MQKKFELYNNLPLDLQHEMGQYLSNQDLMHMLVSSKSNLTLFKPMIDSRRFLHYVVHGEHDIVRELLKKNISIIFNRGRVTDCSGRVFENISGFEYAIWALDKHMWAIMLGCLVQNQEQKQYIDTLLLQYIQCKQTGITYWHNNKKVTETHFNFQKTIINELQEQVDFFNRVGLINLAEAEKQWIQGVGGAQALLPMHVVDEYCSKKPFDPLPSFSEKPAIKLRQIYNWKTAQHDPWFSSGSKLGVTYAVYKGSSKLPGQRQLTGAARAERARSDLVAMTALFQERLKDFINLEKEFETVFTAINQSELTIS